MLVQVGKTECELFAEQALKNNGVWYLLGARAEGSWYKTQSWYLSNNNYYGDTPVYQVFDQYGRRVFASTNIYSAVAEFEKLSQKED